MKNKILTSVLAGIMAISMVACGSGSADIQEVAEESVPASGQTAQAAADWEENSIGYIKEISGEVAPEIDIRDCYTFTDLLNNNRVTSGMGYANVSVGDMDCFFVTSGTYDNMDGNMAGIDATIFIYDDGDIVELGKICSGGTAYPIATNNGYIYTASNHWICKYEISDDNTLKIIEKASVTYDENGVGTYFYDSEDGGNYSSIDSAQAEEIMNGLFSEMGDAEIINFDTVK